MMADEIEDDPQDPFAKARQTLGQSFDYGQIESVLKSPAAAQLPDSVRLRLQGLVDSSRGRGPAIRPDASFITRPDPTPPPRPPSDVEFLKAVAQDFAHNFTVGKVKESSLPADVDARMYNAVVKPFISMAAFVVEAEAVAAVTALSFVGKVPAAMRIMEALPQRTRAILRGGAVMGVPDAMRPDGIPEDPSNLDLPANVAKELTKFGVPDRIALGLGGAATGGIINGVLSGVVSGMVKGRELYVASRLSPEQVASMRSALGTVGVAVDEASSRYAVFGQFMKNFRKLSLDEDQAGMLSDRFAREQYISDEILGSANSAQEIVPATTSTQDLSHLIPKGNAGIQIEPGAGQIIKVAARDKQGNPIGLLTLSKTSPTTADVFTVYVDPAHRRQGIASKLYAEAEKSGLTLRSGQSGLTPEGKAFIEARTGKPAPVSDLQLQANTLVDEMTKAQTVENGRLMAGIFRNNPGGTSLVSELTTDPSSVVALAKLRLGINLSHRIVVRGSKEVGGVKVPSYDVLIARPNYEFVPAVDQAKRLRKASDALKTLSASAQKDITAAKTTEAFILYDGSLARGGLQAGQIEKALRLQRPMAEGTARVDLAFREATQAIRINMPANKELMIELPRVLTNEQFRAIGRSVDAVPLEKVTIKAIDGTETVLNKPMGGQVQDAIAKHIRPKSVSNPLTDDLVNQYGRTGVFKGQAVILPDGSPAEMVNKQGIFYKVRDPITGAESKVHGKSLTVLPTTLKGEFQPSNLFLTHLSETERQALAKLRQGIAAGWAEPMKRFRDFESFANTRGYVGRALRGGKIELTKINDSGAEPITFANMRSAVEWVRKDGSALPELTPDRMRQYLGEDSRVGWIGGGGPPPLLGETVPIDWDRMKATQEAIVGARGPSSFETWLKPSWAMFRDIDKRLGTQFEKAFQNLQNAEVAKQNFEAAWYGGKGLKMPEGVVSIKQIEKMAGGKDANWELITDWRELDKASPEAAAIWAELTQGEQKAAVALGKWYDSIYKELGVEAPFVENYMPRLREVAPRSGTDPTTMWRMIGEDPLNLPKGMDWASDHIREGLLDVYDKHALRVATQYLRAGANSRFTRAPWDEAREMVRRIAATNEPVALPFAHFMQSLRGREFWEQRQMLNATFEKLFDSIPGYAAAGQIKNTAELMTDYLTGAVYSSTLGFRPALALRNASSAMVMVWPVYGGSNKARFLESIGRAMSSAGKAEAIADRAISVQQGGLFASREILADMPDRWRRFNEVGSTLYDSADQFTRATAYWAARVRAEDAITDFARVVDGATPRAIEAAKKKLLTESRMFLFSKDTQDEFLRRVGNNPELAARYAGKVGADMTNFLYGKGMQSRMLRSVGGRLFGQFGTWSLWYVDYLKRVVGRAAFGANSVDRSEGLKILARHAIVNAAILYTGKQVLGIDMSRWASYGAVFYSGGPYFSALQGASTLMRGLGEAASLNEDPLANARITEGLSTIWHTLPSVIPTYYGGRDILRFAEAGDNVERLAAALGTRPTRNYSMNKRLDILLGVRDETTPFATANPGIEDHLNARATGAPMIDIRGLPVLPSPQQSPVASPASSQQSTVRMPSTTLSPVVPPNVGFQPQGEALKSNEASPISNF